MADTFAQQMLRKVKCVLDENVGVAEVQVNGTKVRYDDLLKQYEYWKREVALESGGRRRVRSINLRNA
jgi:hypothetical protein